MVKKRGLGKSLDALLAYSSPEVGNQTATIDTPPESSHEDKLCRLAVEEIQRGKYQPRRDMDPQALEELANSIRMQGIIQPIIVRPAGNRYEIIAGERRWRAAQLAGLTEVPAIVRNVPDEAAIALALIENIQRENLNPIEEAIALQRLIDEFEMTHQQVAEAVGKSRATITNLLRLLSLPLSVKNMLERRTLEMGHARALITLPEALQVQAAELIAARGMSVRDAESLVRRMQNETGVPTSSAKPIDPDIKRLQDNLSRRLRLRVGIQCNTKGRGKIVIHYRNLKELDDLLLQLQEDPA